MNRIEWIEDDMATGEVAEVYAAWRRANPGRTRMPDILKCFSHRADTLREVIRLSYDLQFRDGHLTWKTKELLATYVSALNQCPYCTTSHAFFLEKKDDRPGLADAVSGLNLEGVAISDAERELLKFAEKLTTRSWQTTEADMASLREQGWTEPQVAEAVYVIAMFNLFNRVANAFGLEAVNYREVLGNQPIQFTNPLTEPEKPRSQTAE
jgi:uncharacterized peroxidase-related enzyme